MYIAQQWAVNSYRWANQLMMDTVFLFVVALNLKSKEKIMRLLKHLKQLLIALGMSLALVVFMCFIIMTTVDFAYAVEKYDVPNIQKSMDVQNPFLEFSSGTKIYNDDVYMAIIAIHPSYSVPYHRDMQLIELMGIKKLNIYLNCPGGSVIAGFALFDDLMTLKQNGVHITIHARGLVGSMAIPILLAGDERIGSEHTQFFIHPHRIIKQGLFAEEQRDLDIQTQNMKTNKKFYVDILTKTTKLSKTKISELMDKTTYFTVQQALEWGFIDKIIGE